MPKFTVMPKKVSTQTYHSKLRVENSFHSVSGTGVSWVSSLLSHS
ncbi:hypothetical protein SBY92_001415 [Candida maltosa Xu316]